MTTKGEGGAGIVHAEVILSIRFTSPFQNVAKMSAVSLERRKHMETIPFCVVNDTQQQQHMNCYLLDENVHQET